MAALPSGVTEWLDDRPGAPIIALGAGYVAFGMFHLLGVARPLPIDWAVNALYQLLALSVVYGGLKVTERAVPWDVGLAVLAGTVAFGFIGIVVAAALIALQLRRGVALRQIWFLMAAASVTTAAIGIGLGLYRLDLRRERGNLAAQADTVSELNKRLTVLHRVLRHNLRNELTVIRGRAEMLADREPAPAVAESLDVIVDHTRRIESLSENAFQLRQVWAEDAVVEQEVTELIENCVRELREVHPGVEIETELPAHAVVRAHPRLRLAVLEALENAVVHNDPIGLEITVRVSRLTGANPGYEIAIADTGGGIPDFEPAALDLDQERPLQHATSLGLWLLFWVVEQSDGTLRFDDNDPHGTVVRLQLPAAPS